MSGAFCGSKPQHFQQCPDRLIFDLNANFGGFSGDVVGVVQKGQDLRPVVPPVPSATEAETVESLRRTETALREHPGDPLALLNLAVLLDRSGARERAILAYQTFLQTYDREQNAPLTVPLVQIRERLVHLQSR